MKIIVLITALIAAGLVDKGAPQTECGYIRGAIRLQGGRNGREGRVEVCNDGFWGSVCDGGWDNLDAAVVCRELGLLTTDTVALAVNDSYFGGASGSPWLNNMDCDGSEATLVECLTPQQQRSHWPDLHCTTYAGLLCIETDGGQSVRLVGGRNEREGRVEVFYGGEWGAVCGGDHWGTQEANVVCRELGLLDTGAVSVNGSLFSGSGIVATTVALLDGIECSGDENYLFVCRGGTWGDQQCSSGPAGVTCLQSGGCSEGAIRLAGGNTAREGRVQTCHGGVWGAVCREGGGQWMNTDADIVCRQLGYQEPDERGAETSSPALYGGQANGVIWLFSADCGGPLQQPCTPQHWVVNSCTHTDDLAVSCPDPKEQLHVCVNITAETLFPFGTLYTLYNSVSSTIVTQVSAGCSQPCSYSTRDVSFDSSWAPPFQPSTACMVRNATLGFRFTCRYRPRLNDNGRVQLVAFSTLRGLGSIISCANFRGYVITRDIAIQKCTDPEPTPVARINPSTAATNIGESSGMHTSSRGISIDTPPSSTYQTPEYTTTVPLNTGVVTQSLSIASSSQFHESSGAVTLMMTSTSQFHVRQESSGTVALTSTSSPLPLSSHSSSALYSTSTFKSEIVTKTQMIHVNRSTPEVSTLSFSGILSTSTATPPGAPVGEDGNTNISQNIIAILVGVFVSLLFLLLLVVFCLASVNLCMRRVTKKRRHLRRRGTDLTTPPCSAQRITVHPMTTHNGTDKPIQSINPLSQVVSRTVIGYYEDVDDCHEYAVLEQTTPLQQSSQVTTDLNASLTTSADHDYVLLDRPEKRFNQQLPTDVTKQKWEGTCVHEAPKLNGTVEGYATLEPPARAMVPKKEGTCGPPKLNGTVEGYSILEPQAGATVHKKEGTCVHEASKLNGTVEGYATLEPQAGATVPTTEGACVHVVPPKLNGTVEGYSILKPEPGTTVPANPGDYSKLNHHDYQRVLPNPDSDYDRTFAGGLFDAFSWTNHT